MMPIVYANCYDFLTGASLVLHYIIYVTSRFMTKNSCPFCCARSVVEVRVAEV